VVFILIPIISFYFLLDWERMLQSMRRLIPRPYEESTLVIVRECHSVLERLLKVSSRNAAIRNSVWLVAIIGLEVGLIIGMVAGLQVLFHI
jgi:predicted PurR-regulated permease PerM